MRAKTTHRTAVTVLFFTIVLCLLTAGGCKMLQNARTAPIQEQSVSVLVLEEKGFLWKNILFQSRCMLMEIMQKREVHVFLQFRQMQVITMRTESSCQMRMNRRSRLLSLQRNTAVRLQLNFLIVMSVSFTAEHVPIRHMMNGRICF